MFLTDLADVLRGGGLRVVEVDGWRSRSYRGWSPGFVVVPSHVMVHHTASSLFSTPVSDVAYILGAVFAPLANLYLARDGTFHVVAAGRSCTNGAGRDSWGGGVPDDMMNHHAIGIEAANNGVGEPWPKAQTDAYVAGCAALCAGYQIPSGHVRAHHEWAPGRKIDPAGQSPWAVGANRWDMNRFRFDVANAISSLPPVPLPPIDEETMTPIEPPSRVLDTRILNRPLAAGEIREVAVAFGGSAAVVNLTVIPLGGVGGVLTAWNARHVSPPATSNVNWSGVDGAVANVATIGLTNSSIKVRSSVACHLVVDTQAVWA